MSAPVQSRSDSAALIMREVESRQQEMEALAPKGYTADYFYASLRLYFASSPKLLTCSAVSVARAMLRVAQTGLELGVSCDILPFESRRGGAPAAQFNPRTCGLVELMLKAGVRSVNYAVVREGDFFEYTLGAPPSIQHRPLMPNKGLILAAWSSIETKHGSYQIVVMSKDDIDGIRKAYSQNWKSGDLEDIPWYAAKTVLRQGAKYAPKNPRLAAALRFDEDAPLDPAQEVSPVPVMQGSPSDGDESPFGS